MYSSYRLYVSYTQAMNSGGEARGGYILRPGCEQAHTILNVTTCSKDISPALYFSTRILYILTGEEPVGRPKMKGCSAVGLKVLILSLGALEGPSGIAGLRTNR